jgi:hypothetical protein
MIWSEGAKVRAMNRLLFAVGLIGSICLSAIAANYVLLRVSMWEPAALPAAPSAAVASRQLPNLGQH